MAYSIYRSICHFFYLKADDKPITLRRPKLFPSQVLHWMEKVTPFDFLYEKKNLFILRTKRRKKKMNSLAKEISMRKSWVGLKVTIKLMTIVYNYSVMYLSIELSPDSTNSFVLRDLILWNGGDCWNVITQMTIHNSLQWQFRVRAPFPTWITYYVYMKNCKLSFSTRYARDGIIHKIYFFPLLTTTIIIISGIHTSDSLSILLLWLLLYDLFMRSWGIWIWMWNPSPFTLNLNETQYLHQV